MVWTTPISRKNEHQSWHVFRRGGCLYCGYHCDDCPIGVATCKCTPISIADKILAQENAGITSNWRD